MKMFLRKKLCHKYFTYEKMQTAVRKWISMTHLNSDALNCSCKLGVTTFLQKIKCLQQCVYKSMEKKPTQRPPYISCV